LSTDIALVLSPQAVNSCLGGLGKAKKGLMAHAQKSMRGIGSSGKRSSAKKSAADAWDSSTFDDPNAVKTELNQYAVMHAEKARSNGDASNESYSSLKKQHEEDLLLIQELRAQLDERGGVSTSRAGGRPQSSIKKSFSPVDATQAVKPLLRKTRTNDDIDGGGV
jgi:hypothetical protein